MAKVILEFDAVEDQEDIRTALDGYKWKLAVWDIDQKLRETTKHGMSILKHNETASDIEYEVAEKYREIIREILNDYNLVMD